MHPSRAKAFTLVELITVIVIIAIAAGLIMPRIVNWDERRAEAGVRRVADVLSGAARRHLFSTQRLAIDFDGQTGRLRVVALRLAAPASFDGTDSAWVEDPLTPSADLEGLSLLEAAADSRALDERRFRVELPPAEPRPAITLRLESTGGRALWTVHLPASGEQAAVIVGEGAPPSDRVDLDEAGLRDEAW